MSSANDIFSAADKKEGKERKRERKYDMKTQICFEILSIFKRGYFKNLFKKFLLSKRS